MSRIMKQMIFGLLAMAPLAALLAPVAALEVDPRITDAEAKRIAAIEKVRPAVVAVFAAGGRGGGSGVIISKDGYALTNFHVVQPTGPTMICGLADGVLYDAVLVGMDPVGDVALIKLLPKQAGKDFPFAAMGDSEKVRVGDWSIAMGNPFLLATDFTPTVTYGLVSGTHRYQYPSGTILEYTDCIQIETSINPGNSGGPLFNLDGEVIGINGRGSFEKRGRVNSGVGYAISINQIRNFMGHLRAGLVVDHATLGAFVKTQLEGEQGRLVVTQMLEESDAARRGLKEGDELISFAGRDVNTVNQYKNVLGIYPRGWRMPLRWKHVNDTGEVKREEKLVRLMGVTKKEIKDDKKPPMPEEGKPPAPKPEPKPMPPGGRPTPTPSGPAAKFYEAKEGYANHYFNKEERQRVAAAFQKHGDFSKLTGTWNFEAEAVFPPAKAGEQPTRNAAKATVHKENCSLQIGDVKYAVEPLKPEETEANLLEPRGSGGLLVALYEWRHLLVNGEKGFDKLYTYGGYEPFYPDGTTKSRVDAEVLITEHAGIQTKWYFSKKDQSLLGFECYLKRDQDPCEVVFADYQAVDGRQLPHRLLVRYGDGQYGALNIKSYSLSGDAAKTDAKENK